MSTQNTELPLPVVVRIQSNIFSFNFYALRSGLQYCTKPLLCGNYKSRIDAKDKRWFVIEQSGGIMILL